MAGNGTSHTSHHSAIWRACDLSYGRSMPNVAHIVVQGAERAAASYAAAYYAEAFG
jgi:hypothetical protein